MSTKTTYQHNYNGTTFTRTTLREYNFIAITNGFTDSWHSTEKSATAAARDRSAIREWPLDRDTGKPYSDKMVSHLLSRGVVLKQVVIGHDDYVVQKINNGKS